MKSLLKIGFLFSTLVSALASCTKDENKNYLEGGTAPLLTSSVSGNIALSFANADEEAVKFLWTNPNYLFTTGVSSQDVNYLLEIDTAGANFTNPAKQTVAISKELKASFTNAIFNDYLLNQLVLKPGMVHNLEVRVKSTLGANNAVPLTSNVLKFAVTPYAIPPKVTPPASGKLFITGSATPGSWMGGGDAEKADQRFTKISDTQYEITLPLTGGGSYVFVPVYGNWDNKYAIAVKNDPNSVNGGDFKAGGEDILAPAASGWYKIVVDFQRGKFTVTPQ